MQPVFPSAGSFVCVQTHGFVPKIIQMATHSIYDHAFIVSGNNGQIVEAMPGGVRKAHISEYAGCRMVVCTEGTAAQRDKVAWAALGYVGIQYNDLDILDLGLESLGLPWRLLGHVAGADGRLICSQMVGLCGQRGGLDWSCGRPSLAAVRPSDLADHETVIYRLSPQDVGQAA